ncbi:MAG: DUF1707 domain-containing protein [Pseudonocardiaceae bacterium]|nr:DUF1707 domain-containing protein [Pseudonocardiaceae bacterium]
MAGNGDIRISSAERDDAVSTLGVHLAAGRLELPECEERCGRAAAARTRAELEALFDDLPAPHPDLSSATPPAQLIQKAGQLVRAPGGASRSDELVETEASKALEVVAGLSFIFGIPAAILLTVFLGMWWVFIPVGVVLIVAGKTAEAAKKPKPGT